MTLLRITSSTAMAFDSLKARMARVSTALGSGTTTTDALANTRLELAAVSRDAKALQLALGQEIANASRREREDRAANRRVS